MKLTFIKEVEVRDVGVNISVDLKKEKSTIIISYTCPDCGGHGCRRENNCNAGSISIELDPGKIDKCLDEESASKLKSIIQKLSSSLTKHQTSTSSMIPFI